MGEHITREQTLMEYWIRWCVEHKGKRGKVTLPCNKLLEIADYIERTRGAINVVRCNSCTHFRQLRDDGFGYCLIRNYDVNSDYYCADGSEELYHESR